MEQVKTDNTFNGLRGALYMALSSLFLFISVLFSLFSAFPLSLAIFKLGRGKGYFVILMTWLAVFVISQFNGNGISLFLSFLPSVVVGISLGEILLRREKPSKGIIKYGLSLSTFVLLVYGFMYATKKPVIDKALGDYAQTVITEIESKKAEIGQSGDGNQIFEVLAFFKNKDEFIKTVVNMFPRFIFVGVFISLWVNLILVLRLRRFFFTRLEYPFSDKDLLSFKIPDEIIWGLIAFIGVTIYGYYTPNEQMASIGETGLWCVGVFYFFQGMGIFLDSLTAFKIVGFFRFFIIFGLLMFVPFWWAVIALIGVFNTFFDFRNKLNNLNKLQGE
jgi:hypothetical protein